MKLTITLLIAFFIVVPMTAQLPTVPIDFESSTINYVNIDFGGVITDNSAINPDPSGDNMSATVLQLTKNTGAAVWAGTAMPLAAPIDFNTNGNILKLKVYSPLINIPFLLKIEDTTSPPDINGNPSVFAEVQMSNSLVNSWETLEYDMALHGAFNPSINYNQVVIFPNFGNTGMGTIYYVDDISYDSVVTLSPCPDTIDVGTFIHSLDSTVRAQDVLISSAEISANSIVQYFAGSNIFLRPEFAVNSGSEFTASILDCCTETTWYEDADGDGLGNPYVSMQSCTQPTGYVDTPRFNVGYSTPTSYPGYTLVWSDEFDGGAVNLNDWVFELGDGCPNLCGWGNNEAVWYQSQNTSVGDDFLTIEAREEVVGGYNYTSSRLKTQGNQSFQYGRIDIRARLPYSQGLWPALWMLGDNITTVSWPACGEIDIMELIGGVNNDNVTHGTGHWDNNGHNFVGGSYTLANGIFADEFHVFSIIWDSQTIKWYVDDNLFYTLDITPSFMSEFHNSFFFIFNVSVGGNWPGYPNASSVFPQTMEVDYVRVFQ